MDDTEKTKEDARFAIALRMSGFVMLFAGVFVAPLGLAQHRWPCFFACLLLGAIAACGAGMIKGRPRFVWVAVGVWLVASAFGAFWLWGTDLAWLIFFPGLPVPLDLVIDVLPATRVLAPAQARSR